MNGKIILITGATNGIGKISALELARMGAEIVLVSRNQSKLDKTAQEIKSATGNQRINTIQADLSSLKDIRKVAEIFLSQYERLDVLLNNAGAMFMSRKESVDGYEMTFALNHLNYFLLTDLLLDTLKKTAQEQGEARVVNVSSGAHSGAKIDFDDIQHKKSFTGFSVYGESKLMNVLFTYELTRRLEGTNVTANALHPGFVDTGFGQNNGWIISFMLNIIQKLVAKSPENGAETNIYLASSPEVKGITGKYWVDKQQKNSSAASHDEAAQKRLWEISEELTELKQAAVV
jgi:NAD(P)-dependent dehydrogenase (short-subunit alcohol dehydrogenase family)